MIRTLIGVAAIAVSVAGPTSAHAQGRAKHGTLTYDVSGRIGMIIGSQKQVQCLFTPSEPGPREVYIGAIRKFGLDLGATSGGEMVWSVYAPFFFHAEDGIRDA